MDNLVKIRNIVEEWEKSGKIIHWTKRTSGEDLHRQLDTVPLDEKVASFQKILQSLDDMREERINFLRNHNLFVDYFDKFVDKEQMQQTGASFRNSKELRRQAYLFPMDLVPERGCRQKINYLESIIGSYFDKPRMVGDFDMMISEKKSEEIDWARRGEDIEGSIYTKCAEELDIEDVAQAQTSQEMGDFSIQTDTEPDQK